MAARSEIYHIFVEAFAQRAPRWVHVFNDANIVTACLIIEAYDLQNLGRELLRPGMYFRAIPRDCSHIIFKHLRGSRYDAYGAMRKFVGRQPREYPHEGRGIVGRPDTNKYNVSINGAHITMFYRLELIFVARPGDFCRTLLNGYRHSNGIVLSGRSAEVFNELWHGAVALAGPMIVPQNITYNYGWYNLTYCCRGYVLATTQISPAGAVSTRYTGQIQVDNAVYTPAASEFKRRIFAQPLP